MYIHIQTRRDPNLDRARQRAVERQSEPGSSCIRHRQGSLQPRIDVRNAPSRVDPNLDRCSNLIVNRGSKPGADFIADGMPLPPPWIDIYAASDALRDQMTQVGQPLAATKNAAARGGSMCEREPIQIDNTVCCA